MTWRLEQIRNYSSELAACVAGGSSFHNISHTWSITSSFAVLHNTSATAECSGCFTPLLNGSNSNLFHQNLSQYGSTPRNNNRPCRSDDTTQVTKFTLCTQYTVSSYFSDYLQQSNTLVTMTEYQLNYSVAWEREWYNPAGFPRDRDHIFLKSRGNRSLFCGNPVVANKMLWFVPWASTSMASASYVPYR